MLDATAIIAAELELLAESRAKPVFHVGDTITATSPSVVIVGEVIGAHESFGGWLEIQPRGMKHTTIPCYFTDPWVFEHVTEVP